MGHPEVASPPTRTQRIGADLSRRGNLVRSNWLVIAQGSVAATLAYATAELVRSGTPTPFAPIAALATVATALGGRLRTSMQFVAGNAIGIALSDVLIAGFGVGYWQLAIVVIFALVSALFAGGSRVIIMQAGASAILVATVAPPTPGHPFNTGRVFDALIGGVIGIAVSALLFPLHPLQAARRATTPVLEILTEGYAELRLALETQDSARAGQALVRLRGTNPLIANFRAGLEAGGEAVRISPLRWSNREELGGYLDAARHLDNALRNLRVMARLTRIGLERGEIFPADFPTAMSDLGAAVKALEAVLTAQANGQPVIDNALSAVAASFQAVSSPSDPASGRSIHVGLYAVSLHGPIRMSAADLIMAVGMPPDSTRALIEAITGESADDD